MRAIDHPNTATQGGDIAYAAGATPPPSDALAEYRETYPEIDAIIRENEGVLTILDEAADGAMNAFGGQRRAFVEVRDKLTELQRGPMVLNADGKLVRRDATDDELDRAERDANEAREIFDAQNARRKQAIEARGNQNGALSKMLSTITAMANQGVEPEFVAPVRLDGNPVDVVEAQRALRADLLKERRATEKLPRLQADVVAEAIAALDAQAAMPSVKVRPGAGGVYISWPRAIVAAESIRDAVPSVIDLQPMLMSIAREPLPGAFSGAVGDVDRLSQMVTGWWCQTPIFRLHSVVRCDGALFCVTPSPVELLRFRPDTAILKAGEYLERRGQRPPTLIRPDPRATIDAVDEARALVDQGLDLTELPMELLERLGCALEAGQAG